MRISLQAFRDVSIRRKLIALSMLTSGVALVLACAAFIVYERVNFRGTVARELSTIAQMVSDSSTAALTFHDRDAARETLSVLKAEPSIVMAAIYDRKGSIFATYIRSGEPLNPPSHPGGEGVRFTSELLEVALPIQVDREHVGTVQLWSDLREMHSRLTRYAGIVLVVLCASSLVALLISSKVQRVISRPILHLAETASLVSANQNYSLRARKPGHDELGILVDRFNEMMAQIQARDAALQEAHEELELRVARRTRELEAEIIERERVQQDLLAAKQVAEESDRAKSAFLANMSHELRTPLNAIIGYSELLEEMAEDSGQVDTISDLRRIHSAGRHLLALINDVLDLSKIEAGRMEVHIEPLPIDAIVRDVSDTVEPLAMRNGNFFAVYNQAGEGVLYADPTKFRQCLLNLLSNACKFTENGRVTLRVARRREADREWLDWHVSDTGIGIDPGHISKLFQSFSQVDSSATRRFGGTGLGLAISQRLCHMMSGDITVQSELGKGSTFTIRMPATRDWSERDVEVREAGNPRVEEVGACPRFS